MIVVSNFSGFNDENIKIDDYIPITVNFLPKIGMQDTILYWRMGDFQKNLFEMGISGNDGKLISFSLILIEIENVSCAQGFVFDVPIVEGIPHFKGKGAKNDAYFDEICDIKLEIKMDFIRIILKEKPIASYVKNRKVKFGIDKYNQLNIIEIDLDNGQLKQIQQAIGIL